MYSGIRRFTPPCVYLRPLVIGLLPSIYRLQSVGKVVMNTAVEHYEVYEYSRKKQAVLLPLVSPLGFWVLIRAGCIVLYLVRA